MRQSRLAEVDAQHHGKGVHDEGAAGVERFHYTAKGEDIQINRMQEGDPDSSS